MKDVIFIVLIVVLIQSEEMPILIIGFFSALLYVIGRVRDWL